jgi:hypothetical protein
VFEDMKVFSLPLGLLRGCVKFCCFLCDWGHLLKKKNSGHFQQALISGQPVNLRLIPKSFLGCHYILRVNKLVLMKILLGLFMKMAVGI